jgi:hypothetical protein
MLHFPCAFLRRKLWIRRTGSENFVRSNIIFRANATIENRFQLCQTAAKYTRLLHAGSEGTVKTINDALIGIAAEVGSPASWLPAPETAVHA